MYFFFSFLNIWLKFQFKISTFSKNDNKIPFKTVKDIIAFLPPVDKIFDFYLPLFYYCSMMSAVGNVTYLSHGEIKLDYHCSRWIYIFSRIFYHRLLGIPKDYKIVYNNFFGKNFPSPRVPLTKNGLGNPL